MTDTVRFDASQVFGLSADLAAAGAKAGARAYAITRTYGMKAQTAIKRRMSQPRSYPRGPNTGGPRLITGDLVRSVAMQMSAPEGNPRSEIGTNKPQGRRLELGFVGVDSAGRHYNQPPYPAWEPGLNEVAGDYAVAIGWLGVEGLE